MDWLEGNDFSDLGITPPPLEDLGPLKRQLDALQVALTEVWEASEKYLKGMGYYEGHTIYIEAADRGRNLRHLLENPWALTEIKNVAPDELAFMGKIIHDLDEFNRRASLNPYARLDGRTVFEPPPGALFTPPPDELPADFAYAEEPEEVVPEKHRFWAR